MLNTTKIAAKITGGAVTVGQAAALVDGIIDLIEFVEDIYEGLKGSEKFAAVKAAAKSLAEQLGIDDDFDKLWKTLGPLVSLIVQIYKLKGLFTK